MYVWQMNDGRWHVSNYTSTKFDIRMCEFDGGFETEVDARKALADWRDRHPDAIQQRW
jgi:hypothetical protein